MPKRDERAAPPARRENWGASPEAYALPDRSPFALLSPTGPLPRCLRRVTGLGADPRVTGRSARSPRLSGGTPQRTRRPSAASFAGETDCARSEDHANRIQSCNGTHAGRPNESPACRPWCAHWASGRNRNGDTAGARYGLTIGPLLANANTNLRGSEARPAIIARAPF